MIDIHCHVLPGIDDGSKSVEMSLSMLRDSFDQGIGYMCFTPHFYADMDDPGKFLRRRDEADAFLRSEMEDTDEPFPEHVLGAEVHYYRGIGRSEDIETLCIGKSRFLLLEPPFRTWTGAFLEDVRALRDGLDLKVIIAHIERYFDQDKRLVKELLSEPGIYIQSNAEAFIDRKTRKKVLKLLEEGKIHFLGSDCHNMLTRPQNLTEGRAVIEEKLGPKALNRIDAYGQDLIDQAV